MNIDSLSFSSISEFLDCPRKFFFEKKLKREQPENRSMVLGEAIHYLLREYYEGKEIAPDRKYPEDILALAKGIIYKYKENYREDDKKYRILNSELPFIFNRNGIKWNGIIDLVAEKDGKIVLIDHKYSARPFRENYFQLSLQSSIYFYYFKYILDKDISQFIYNTISGPNKFNKKGISDTYKFNRFIILKNDAEIENSWAILDRIVEQIKNDDFLPHISRLTCDFCPYAETCIAYQKGFNVLQEGE